MGLFAADVFTRDPSARVICYEPDPENADVVRRSIAANPELDWELVEACAATADGTVSFTSGLFTNSRIERDGVGTAVRAVDVFPHAAEAGFLKIDIEGAEWDLLADPRFLELPAKVVALEYHAYLCPASDPTRLARARLEEAGYAVERSHLHAEPGHGMLWGWKAG